MNANQLNEQLVEALESFRTEIESQFPDDSKSPATISDLQELARQTFYAMDIMREKIIAYLKSQN